MKSRLLILFTLVTIVSCKSEIDYQIDSQRQQQLIIGTALDRYRIDNDTYPKDLSMLTKYLMAKPHEYMYDVWGCRILYEKTPGEIKITSAGPDCRIDTDDDIITYIRK